jgi:hypothetical protein
MSGNSLDGEIWRYRDFLKQVMQGNQHYSPFELDYIEGYRRTNRSVFLDEKWQDLHNKSPEKATWHDNILRLGHFIAHDSHGRLSDEDDEGGRQGRLEIAEQIFKDTKLPSSDYVKDDILTEEEKERAWKNFLGRIRAGIDEDSRIPAGEHTPGSHFWLREHKLDSGAYGGNVDIVAWLPLDGNTWLHQGDGNQKDGKSVNSQGEFKSTIGKDGLVDQGSLEKFRKHPHDFLDAYDPLMTIGKTFQVVYAGELSTKFIRKINDHELTDGWVEFSEYLKVLRKNYIFQLDDAIEEIVIEDDIEEQLNFLNSIVDDLRKLQYYLNEIKKQVESIKNKKNTKYYARIDDFSGLKESFKEIIRIIEGKDVKGPGYSSIRKELISKMDEELNYRKRRYKSPFNEGINSEELMYREEKINHVEEFLSNLDQLSHQIEQIVEECREMGEKEKQRLQNNDEEVTEEEEFQNKLDRKLTEDILEIPNIRPVVEKMEKNI